MERQHPQPLLVDLTFRCPNHTAFLSDQLSDTVDYGMITQRIRDIGENREFSLIVTLTEKISQTLFDVFPITQLRLLWLVGNLYASVGITYLLSEPVRGLIPVH
jgi:FolB domain-containing protein